MGAFQEKQLGQHRINGTAATSIYSPGASVTAIGKSWVICNTTSAPALFSLFHDDDGTTYDESTALYFEQVIAAKTTLERDGFWPSNDSSGNFATKTSVANAITFTLYGAEIS